MGKRPVLRLSRRSRRRLRVLASSIPQVDDDEEHASGSYHDDPESDTASDSYNGVGRHMNGTHSASQNVHNQTLPGGPRPNEMKGKIKGLVEKLKDKKLKSSRYHQYSDLSAQADSLMGVEKQQLPDDINGEETVDFREHDKSNFNHYFSQKITPEDRRFRIVNPYRDFRIDETDDEIEHDIARYRNDIEDDGFQDEHIIPTEKLSAKYDKQTRSTIFTLSVILILTVAITSGVLIGNSHSSSRPKKVEKRPLVQVPPYDLGLLCSLSSIATPAGHQKCEHACSFDSCCMAAGKDSCFLEEEETCGLYSPCGVLHIQTDENDNDETEGQFVSPAPDNLSDWCSGQSIATAAGYLKCQGACHAGQCCLTNNSPEMIAHNPYAIRPCTNSHPHICQGYDPCHALYDDEYTKNTSNVTPPKHTQEDLMQTVYEVCNENALKTDVNAKTECEHACKSRTCCFTSNVSKNCYDDNEVWCEKFALCKNLFTNTEDSANGNF